MITLATQFRAAQFYAHNAHNQASGATFFSDHEFLGELYGKYEDAYDGLIERMIGLGMEFDLPEITCDASSDVEAAGYDHTTTECFRGLLEREKKICEEVRNLMPSASVGTQNFIAQLADDSEVRQYKIGQRLK